MPTDIELQSDGDIALSPFDGDFETVRGNDHVLQRIAIQTIETRGAVAIGGITERGIQRLKSAVLDSLRNEPFADPPYQVHVTDTEDAQDSVEVHVTTASEQYDFQV